MADRTVDLVWSDTKEVVSPDFAGMAASPGAILSLFDKRGSWSRVSRGDFTVAGAVAPPPPVDPPPPPPPPPPVDPPPVDPPPVNPPPPPNIPDYPPGPTQQVVDKVFQPPVRLITIQAPGLFKPTSLLDLQKYLQAVVDGGGGGTIIDPSTHLSWEGTCDVQLKDAGDDGLFFNFNGGRFSSLNKDGKAPGFRFQSVGGGNIRHFQLENLTFYGGGYDSAGCGNGIELLATGGAILLFNFTNVRMSWCGQNGFFVKGDFFEGSTYSISAKDNRASGALFDNNPGVVSNFRMYGSELSRNRNYGLETINGVQSIDSFGSSYVNNDVGGVLGAIRGAYGDNGENTGKILYDLGFLPYPCRIVGSNLSSNGSWKNPANKDSAVSQYLIRTISPDKLEHSGCYVTPYGAPIAMAVMAP